MEASSFSSPLCAGCIVEYLHNNQPTLGWIVEAQNNRVRILNINQREVKLPAARILSWTGPSYSSTTSRNDQLSLLRKHQERREELYSGVDALEIWEFSQGELEIAPVAWFADLLWESPDHDQIAALGRSLLADKSHFKFAPPSFEIYSEEKAAKRAAELEAAAKREKLVTQGQVWLKKLWDVHLKKSVLGQNPDSDLSDSLKELLMTRLCQPDNRENEILWNKMTAGLPQTPHLPLLLAEAWGLVPSHFNYLLAQSQYETDSDWYRPYAELLEEQRRKVLAQAGTPICTDAISIDASTTRDMDDAFSISEDGDNFLLKLVLACPVLHWPFESELDQTIANRFSSIYLPEGNHHLLPEELGTDFFSLVQGADRPAMTVNLRVDQNGSVLDCQPEVQWVRVKANLTYDQVEDNLTERGKPADQNLKLAWQLAQTLTKKRIEQGAVLLVQPDPEFKLTGNDENSSDIQAIVAPKVETPMAQAIVSEFMILANQSLAEWAIDRKVPLIFRTQDISLPEGSAGVWSEPEEIYKMVKNMGPSIMETNPGRHATIGARAYAPLTSPLRRYSDFLNMAQITSFLENEQPRFSHEWITAALPRLSSRSGAVGRVQRYRPRYWKYLYFKQNKKKLSWPAVVVESGPSMVTVALPGFQLFVKAPKNLFGDKPKVGQKFQVTIGKVDPLSNDLKLAEAREADQPENTCQASASVNTKQPVQQGVQA